MSKKDVVFKFAVLALILLSGCAWSLSAQASGYLPPRLSLDANAGGSATVGRADLLLSLKGDDQRNLYLDPQAAYGTDEQWYADLGLGYRWIQNEAAILGAYLFAGHSQVERQSGFWIANPGVEALGSRWDARINGYIPIGSRSNDLGMVEFNRSSWLVFSGHTETLVTSYRTGDETQQIGDGVDAKVGYQVFRNVPLKAYLGGYFFDIPNADNVRGGAAGLEYWFDDHVKVFANYTYDNLQHSTVVGGLAVSFGGVDESRADPSLSERLTDPVERYLANLGHGSGIPSDTELTNLQTGQKSVLSDSSINTLPNGGGPEIVTVDAAFFSTNGSPNNGGVGLTLANCTKENPCAASDFTEIGVNTLNALLPNTQMFFNGGSYIAINGTGALTLNGGQSVLGMNASYSAPAQGAARPTFNGAFILNGNNTLDSIILNNSLGVNTTAITSTGGQNILVNNTDIGSAATPYASAMNLVNASARLTLANLNLSSQAGVTSGILLSGSSLLVQSSTINLVNNIASLSPTGINLLSNSSLTLNSSPLTITSAVLSTNTIGVQVQGASTMLSNHSAISVNTVSQRAAIGFVLIDSGSGVRMNDGSLSVSGSSLSALSLNLGGGSLAFSPNVICKQNNQTIKCA